MVNLLQDNPNQIIAPVVKKIDADSFAFTGLDLMENTERYICRNLFFVIFCRKYQEPTGSYDMIHTIFNIIYKI